MLLFSPAQRSNRKRLTVCIPAELQFKCSFLKPLSLSQVVSHLFPLRATVQCVTFSKS